MLMEDWELNLLIPNNKYMPTKKVEKKKVVKATKVVKIVSQENIDCDHRKITFSDGSEQILFV